MLNYIEISSKLKVEIIYFCILSSLFINSEIYSQKNEIRFNRISLQQGLSQSSVFSIVQDKYGFLWFATLDGLNKYDGYKFTVFRHNPLDSNSISDLGIRKLFKDSKNNLWVITLTGKLDKYDYDKDIFKHYIFKHKDTPRSARIIDITETPDGKLWAGAISGKLYLYVFDKNSFQPKELTEEIQPCFENIHLQTLCSDNNSEIWMGTWEGLIKFIPSSNKAFLYKASNEPHSLSGNLIMNIVKDKTGNIWIATADGGISMYDQLTNEFNVYRHKPNEAGSLSSDRTMSICVDGSSNLWVGTIDAGLCLLKNKSKSFLNYKYNPSYNSSIGNGAIMSVFEDNTGGLWFGTLSGGISKYNYRNQRFLYISHHTDDPGSISSNTILSILKDSQGRLWVGTDGGGLDCKLLGEKNFSHYLNNSNPGSNSITIIFEDSRGNIWTGSDPGVNSAAGAIYLLKPNSRAFSLFSKMKLKIGGFQSIIEDRMGNIWIGAAIDGLWCYDYITGKVKNYKNNPTDSGSICGNSIYTLLEDSEGKIWIGTQNSGLSCYDQSTGKFISYRANPFKSDSLNNNSIWSLYEDNDKNIWVGTWGGGLNCFDKNTGRFKQYTINDGLPSNIICSIQPDNSGNLWIGTNNGLAKFNIRDKSFKNFFQTDGLQSDEFNQGASFKSPDGYLYFGGINGITVFNPDQITDNPNIPLVMITQFYVNNSPLHFDEPVSFLKEITLTHEQNFFSIEFAALDYTAPEKNQFSYMLEGIDKSWINSGNMRRVYYTDISPGKYLFHVKGSNNDGVWNNQETLLSIIITPPFWQTWWFKVLPILLLSAILYSLHKYRLNKLLEVERTRLRIAKDLHDDVSATLTGIVYFSNAISKEVGNGKNPLLQNLLSLIRESTAEVQEEMHDIIWSINPENDKWEIILPKFRRYASDLCESKGITYSINIPETLPGKSLSMEKRRNLWLIFKEIVTNAVKHSECSKLDITIKVENEYLSLLINDNGKGFDPQKPTDRNGIKNIKSRSASLIGKLNLKTCEGNGTQWTLSIPL